MHPRAAGSRYHHEGASAVGGALGGAGDFFADGRSHAAPEEGEIHHGQRDWIAFDGGGAGDDGLGRGASGVLSGQALRIAGEGEGVHGAEPAIVFRERVGVGQGADAGLGSPGEVVAASGADAQVLFELLIENHLAAGRDSHLVQRPSGMSSLRAPRCGRGATGLRRRACFVTVFFIRVRLPVRGRRRRPPVSGGGRTH